MMGKWAICAIKGHVWEHKPGIVRERICARCGRLEFQFHATRDGGIWEKASPRPLPHQPPKG